MVLENGKWIIESRIEFPDPMLMTLDRGKIIFSPLWFLILKPDHNLGLHTKIREKFQVIESEGFYGL